MSIAHSNGESRFVNKWLWVYHRDKPQWRRTRLGALPDKEMSALYSVTLRWADAIILDGNELVIVEAKLNPVAGAIGQLELYRELIRATPEFDRFSNLPIKLVFLTTRLDLQLLQFCTAKGITYEHVDLAELDELYKQGDKISPQALTSETTRI